MDNDRHNSHAPAAAPDQQEAGPGICPYCGAATADPEACQACGGLLEPLSRQATQNAMGPWFIRDEAQPFRPGCSLATLKRLIARGAVKPETVIRGPSTRQFWSLARNAPGVAHLMGECHNCHGPADADEYMCRACGAVFMASNDRQSLGLAPVRLLPGEAPPEVVAESATARPAAPRQAMPAPLPLPTAINPAPAVPVAPPPSSPPPAAPTRDAAAVTRLSRELESLRRIVGALAGAAVVLLGAVVLLLFRTAPAPLPVVAPESAAAPAPVVSEPAPDWQARLDAAIAAGEAGTEEDLAKSVALLEAIQAEAPADQVPPGLAGALESARRRLDEAALRKFMK